MKSFRRMLFAAAAMLAVSPLSAQEWGDLSGTFILTEKAPVPAQLKITKDLECCAQYQEEVVDETIIVGETGGLSGVYIWLRPSSRQKLKIHPDLEKQASENPAVIENLHCKFQPHTVALWAGKQKLIVKNSDPIPQVVKIDTLKNQAINVTMGIGDQVEQKFNVAERLPGKVTCGLHPWESAYLLPTETPYFATTDKSGKFTIKNIPAGEWDFQLWHESVGYFAAKPEWEKGRFSHKIAVGSNDLGDIKLTLKELTPKKK